MNKIVTRPTKSNSICKFISKIREISPRLRVMHNNSGFTYSDSAILANRLISSNALITPFVVKKIVTPRFVASVSFSSLSFSFTLLNVSSLIRTGGRTKAFRPSLVGIFVKESATSFASFVCTLFAHQYDYSKEGK